MDDFDKAATSDGAVLKNALKDIIKFLKHFHWLHDFAMTKVLLNGTLQKLPEDWTQWFAIMGHDINLLCDPIAIDVDCPSLRDFLAQCLAYNIQTLLEGDLRFLSYESILSKIDISDGQGSKVSDGRRNGFYLIECPSGGMIDKCPSGASSLDVIRNDHLLPGTSDAKSNCPISGEEDHVPSDVGVLEDATESVPSPIWKVIRPTNPKKKHETENLALFMLKVKEVTKSSKILDIGSGLGYVDLFLHMKYGYKILGLESSSKITSSAVELRDKCIGRACGSVQYVSHHIDGEGESLGKVSALIGNFSSSSPSCGCNSRSKCQDILLSGGKDGRRWNCSRGSEPPLNFDVKSENLENHSTQTESRDESRDNLVYGQESSPSHRCSCVSRENPQHNRFSCSNVSYVDMLSLHSCGDLSPLMLKLFVREGNISSLTMVSCCYHKMKTISGADFPSFQNFPLSQMVGDLLTESTFNISVFGLRLASEEPFAHWKKRCGADYDKDVQSLFYRAILENVCENNELTVTKLKRRTAKKSSYKTFEEYVEVILKNFEFRRKGTEAAFPDESFLRRRLSGEHVAWKVGFRFLGFLRALQLSLQPVLESLVLIDRVAYLRESGLRHSGLVTLFDENVSPRNKAIFSLKNK